MNFHFAHSLLSYKHEFKLLLSTATSSKEHNSPTAAAKRVSISFPTKQNGPQNTLLDHEYGFHRWAYSLKKTQAAPIAAEALLSSALPWSPQQKQTPVVPATQRDAPQTQAALSPTITLKTTLSPHLPATCFWNQLLDVILVFRSWKQISTSYYGSIFEARLNGASSNPV